MMAVQTEQGQKGMKPVFEDTQIRRNQEIVFKTSKGDNRVGKVVEVGEGDKPHQKGPLDEQYQVETSDGITQIVERHQIEQAESDF